MVKQISFSRHALEQMNRRGTDKEEVMQAIRSATWEPTRDGRYECRYDFAYNAIWNDKYYTTKQVRPIFVEEDQIVVITVYTYYIKERT